VNYYIFVVDQAIAVAIDLSSFVQIYLHYVLVDTILLIKYDFGKILVLHNFTLINSLYVRIQRYFCFVGHLFGFQMSNVRLECVVVGHK
jgi:hypothetical protein